MYVFCCARKEQTYMCCVLFLQGETCIFLFMSPKETYMFCQSEVRRVIFGLQKKETRHRCSIYLVYPEETYIFCVFRLQNGHLFLFMFSAYRRHSLALCLVCKGEKFVFCIFGEQKENVRFLFVI